MRTLDQIVTFVLLGAMMATSAGALCLVSSQHSAAASGHAGCHPAPIPSKSAPGDLQCCLHRHPSALLTSTFSPRPPQPALAADPVSTNTILVAGKTVPSLDTSSSSDSPPSLTTLRI